MCNKSNNNGDGKRLPCRPKCYRRKRENNRETCNIGILMSE